MNGSGQVISAEQFGNPYIFTGRRYDAEAELYHYRTRVYSPQLGRFLQTDPIGYADGMNMYGYVGNNPVNFVDPMGLKRGIGWTLKKGREAFQMIGHAGSYDASWADQYGEEAVMWSTSHSVSVVSMVEITLKIVHQSDHHNLDNM